LPATEGRFGKIVEENFRGDKQKQAEHEVGKKEKS
jgi:hypothetical protein